MEGVRMLPDHSKFSFQKGINFDSFHTDSCTLVLPISMHTNTANIDNFYTANIDNFDTLPILTISDVEQLLGSLCMGTHMLSLCCSWLLDFFILLSSSMAWLMLFM